MSGFVTTTFRVFFASPFVPEVFIATARANSAVAAAFEMGTQTAIRSARKAVASAPPMRSANAKPM